MTKTVNIKQLEKLMLSTDEARKAFEDADRELAMIEQLYIMREHANLNQKALAERLGVSASAVRRLEKSPLSASIKTLERYAHACGANISLNVEYR